LTPYDFSVEIEIVRKVAEEGSGADNTAAENATVSGEDGRPCSYRVKDDVDAHVVQFTTKYVNKPGTGHTQQPDNVGAPNGQVPESGTGLNEDFKLPPDSPSERFIEPFEESDPRFKGGFPNQRIALRFLLPDHPSDWGAMMGSYRAPERMQYFHVPSNNMQVSDSQHHPPHFL